MIGGGISKRGAWNCLSKASSAFGGRETQAGLEIRKEKEKKKP